MEENSSKFISSLNETNEQFSTKNEVLVNTLDTESEHIETKRNNLETADEYIDPTENCLEIEDKSIEPIVHPKVVKKYIKVQRSSISTDDELYLEPIETNLRRNHGTTDVQSKCTNTNCPELGECPDVEYLEPNKEDFQSNIEYENEELELKEVRPRTNGNSMKNRLDADSKHVDSSYFKEFTQFVEDSDVDLIYDDLIDYNEQTLSVKHKHDKTISMRWLVYLLLLFITIVLTSVTTYAVTAFGKQSPCSGKICETGSCYINSNTDAVCVCPTGSTGHNCKVGNSHVSEIRTSCKTTWTQYDKWCYKVYTDKKTWFQSRDFCRGIGADLVSIHNENETFFLFQEFRLETNIYWIGMRDFMNDEFVSWSDGTISRYTNWGDNNFNENERCVQLNPKFPGKWNGNNCFMSSSFICKHNTTSLCESGSWVYHNRSCYLIQHVFISGKTRIANWNQAREECRINDEQLVKIESQTEYNFLLSQVTKLSTKFVWIGLRAANSSGHYLWDDGTLPSFQSWSIV